MKNVGVGENTVSSQIHHIFPEAEYKLRVGESINSVFNYTFLTNEANNFISDKATDNYLNEIISMRQISTTTLKEILSKHIIDEECYDYMKQERYEEFLKQRAECVRKKLIQIGIKIQNVAKEQIDEEIDDEDLISEVDL